MWSVSNRVRSTKSKKNISFKCREAIIIAEALEDPNKRKMLVNELSKINMEEANLIKFYQACQDYRSIGWREIEENSLFKQAQERAGLGKKIISMFIEGGSIYELFTIGTSIKADLVATRVFTGSTFDVAYLAVEDLLYHSERVVRTAQKIGVIHANVMEAIKIMSTVEDDKRRRMLVNELVQENLEEAHELRFLQACKSYQEEPDQKKMAALGRKIVTMFIEAGSPYELQNLHEITRMKLLETKKFSSNTFETATEQVLHGLETSSPMIKAAKAIGVVESSILSGRSAGAPSTINPDVFEKMMNNPLLADEFEKFVRDELIDELWKFRSDVGEWKFLYNDRSEEENRGKAAEIYEMSVKPESQYEINISGDMKERIENTLNYAIATNTKCPVTLFDEALKEVSTMLFQNINFRVMNAVRISMNINKNSSSSSQSSRSIPRDQLPPLARVASSKSTKSLTASLAESGRDLLSKVLSRGGNKD